jgi:hypothetical protein
MPENDHTILEETYQSTLNRQYLSLFRNWSLWEEPLDEALKEIAE